MDYLIKATVLLILFYFCYKLLLQKETFFEYNRWFLLGGMILSVLLPFVVIPVYIEVAPQALLIPNLSSTDISYNTQTSGTMNWTTLFYWVYAIMSLVFVSKLIIEFVSLTRILNSEHKIDKKDLKFLPTSYDTPPFSFFKTIVFNPNHFNEDDLDYILKHEEVHARQWHSLDIIIAKLVTALFWFNPLVWLYKKELIQNLEYIADDHATKYSDSKKTYQLLLLKASVPKLHLELTNNFYNSLIKNRIIMLHKSKSQKLKTIKFAAILPLLALFLMSFSTEEILLIPTAQTDVNHSNLVTNSSTINSIKEKEMIVITKDMTDADFENLVESLSAKQIKAKFKGIKRNKAGDITAIKIEVSSDSSTANFNISTDEAIEPISIIISDGGKSVNIGNSGKTVGENVFFFETDDEDGSIQTTGNGKNIIIIKDIDESSDSNDDEKNIKVKRLKKNNSPKKIMKRKIVTVEKDDDTDSTIIVKDGDEENIIKTKKIILKDDDNQNLWTEEDGDVIELSNSGENALFISTDSGKNPLYIIDGKEVPKGKITDLLPEKIESINVLKGEKALEKYGDKGKNGVIEIKTKKD